MLLLSNPGAALLRLTMPACEEIAAGYLAAGRSCAQLAEDLGAEATAQGLPKLRRVQRRIELLAAECREAAELLRRDVLTPRAAYLRTVQRITNIAHRIISPLTFDLAGEHRDTLIAVDVRLRGLGSRVARELRQAEHRYTGPVLP